MVGEISSTNPLSKKPQLALTQSKRSWLHLFSCVFWIQDSLYLLFILLADKFLLRKRIILMFKGRLDCDSRRVFYTTLEATQTRRTDLWVFTLLLSEFRLFCVFLFLNGGHLTAGSPLDRCVHQLAKGFQYSYIACLLLMVYGDYLCISIYF